MYGSPPSNDLSRPFPPPYGHRQLKEETELHSRWSHQQQQQQMSSGLLRYRSAPSSLFGEACEDFLSASTSCLEAETLFERLLSHDPRDKPPLPTPPLQQQVAVPAVEKNAAVETAAFSSAAAVSQMIYQQQQIANNLVTSMGMDEDQIKNGSSLIRQSSSPAGLFSHLNVENGYGVMRGIGGFRNGNEGATRLRSQLSFSSRQSSAAAAMMSQISEEAENEPMEGYPVGSWPEESSLLSDNYFRPGGGLKRTRENQSEIQNGEVRNGLAQQFSLPKAPSERAAMEKLLQFGDSVPCKIRAKRGCATQPRSIAERVRRTKISERMRKLQELVPNMDKQTNTADMLDLAVDYIKELQKQAKTLSAARANCTCSSSKQKPHLNSTAA
ncbi:putative transcription factor bHLH130 [Iris pallida]|uniref:Transcription factor bHLH130 n=1 Tax=Iris pallida TaxID=29817 RepID=A0AAX6GJU1_IRIPA|nr:putative transcription factor bHLH130 [Iris pallida]